jgi:hypothetical protein
VGDWYQGPGGRWVYDPNAPAPTRDPTTAIPQVNAASLRDEEPPSPQSRRKGDERAPVDVPRAGDIGDWIDPNAPDPTGDEITDPEDPNYVDPWQGSR